MGYAWETYYYFQSHSGTSGLFLNCEGNGEIGDNQNVSIYKSTGSGENKDHLFKLTRAYTADGRTAAGRIHFVVAYKFINDGSKNSFYVLDPGTGSACTLEAAMIKNSQKDTVYNYIQTKRNESLSICFSQKVLSERSFALFINRRNQSS